MEENPSTAEKELSRKLNSPDNRADIRQPTREATANTGVNICAYTGVNVCAYTGVNLHAYMGVNVPAYTGVDIRAYTGVDVCAYMGVDVCAFTGVNVCADQRGWDPKGDQYQESHVTRVQ